MAVVACVAAVAGIVRYARRVEAGLLGAPDGSALTLKFFRNPPDVKPFAVTDVDGRTISSTELRGKVVLINFWATWCPPCRDEIPDLIALQAKYRDQLQIIGVSQDSGSATAVKAFAAAAGMNYPIVTSTPEIELLFPGVHALPTSFIVDREQRLVQKHVGRLNAAMTEAETRSLAGLAVNASVERIDEEDKVRLANAAQANKIPGIDLAPLSADQRAAALKQLNSDPCTCGCGLTVAQCRVDDPTCAVSLPIAQEIVKNIAAPARRSSADRRASPVMF